MSEARTRRDLIDPALLKAGWDVSNPALVGLEIPVDGSNPAAVQAVLAQLRHVHDAPSLYAIPLPPGISDYALYRDNGEIAAIVEAKRTSIDPRLAQAQAEFYVQEIEKRQSFRSAILLIGGNKKGAWVSWYRQKVSIADRLYDDHLAALRREGELP